MSHQPHSLLNRASGVPALLVSVRDATEAKQALIGGADIIDVKEPMHGSLGMANPTAIRAIADVLSPSDQHPPLSIAVGEATEWASRDVADQLTCCEFAKLGLAGLGNANWQKEWQHARESASKLLANRHWVAVAYADHCEANSPTIHDIADEAIRIGAAGFLIDTYTKGRGGLLEFVSPAALSELIERMHEADLFVALAGQVTEQSLPNLLPLQADVIAIRTAACRGGDRNGHVDAEAIQAFKQAMAVSS